MPRRVPAPSGRVHPFPAATRCPDPMAPPRRSRKLWCFYCGHRASIEQDGTIREWKCKDCEAVNYLDENGEIADPPDILFNAASDNVRYAQPVDRAESPSSDSPFCEDCLKNQHLVRTSLAQYFSEDDDDRALDRDYYKFKESLEKRYPQVCEDCFDGVLDRIKRSSYTAKTDHLRIFLDKSRQKGISGKTKTTWLDIPQNLGHVLWKLGLFCQVLCNLQGALVCVGQRIDFNAYRISMLSLKDYGLSIIDLAKYSALLTVLSIWWNPKFKEGYRGYRRHIKGFSEWYKSQAVLLFLRVLFWVMMSKEVLDHTEASATLGAHIFVLAFSIYVISTSYKCIKVDFNPLFAPTSPERLQKYVRQTDKSKYNGHDLSQALNDIQDEFSAALPTPPSSQTDVFPGESLKIMSLQDRPGLTHNSPLQHASRSVSLVRHSASPTDPHSMLGIRQTVPSLSEMTEDESYRYLTTGDVPARLQMVANNDLQEDMDWKPEMPQYRAFQPDQAPRKSQLFSQAPVDPNPSPFWYKGLPAAPLSQAHKLRNPPNKPRLLAHSQEAKENFFNKVTGRKTLFATSGANMNLEQDAEPVIETRRHEVEFRQPRFFPPNTSDVMSGLSDLFEQAFTLKSDQPDDGGASQRRPASQSTRRKRHVFTAMVLLLAWLGWNYSFSHPNIHTVNIPLVVMVACGAIALQSLPDYTTSSWSNDNPRVLNAAGVVLAALQTVAVGYGISQILAGKGDCFHCQSQGAILVSVMFIQEVCFAAL